jgi:hypothetical protein
MDKIFSLLVFVAFSLLLFPLAWLIYEQFCAKPSFAKCKKWFSRIYWLVLICVVWSAADLFHYYIMHFLALDATILIIGAIMSGVTFFDIIASIIFKHNIPNGKVGELLRWILAIIVVLILIIVIFLSIRHAPVSYAESLLARADESGVNYSNPDYENALAELELGIKDAEQFGGGDSLKNDLLAKLRDTLEYYDGELYSTEQPTVDRNILVKLYNTVDKLTSVNASQKNDTEFIIARFIVDCSIQQFNEGNAREPRTIEIKRIIKGVKNPDGDNKNVYPIIGFDNIFEDFKAHADIYEVYYEKALFLFSLLEKDKSDSDGNMADALDDKGNHYTALQNWLDKTETEIVKLSGDISWQNLRTSIYLYQAICAPAGSEIKDKEKVNEIITNVWQTSETVTLKSETYGEYTWAKWWEENSAFADNIGG